MRTISLRQFRVSIPDLHEPVEVTRRTKAGDYETLGQWTPASVTYNAAPSILSDALRDMRQPVGTAMAQAERDAVLNRVNRKGAK